MIKNLKVGVGRSKATKRECLLIVGCKERVFEIFPKQIVVDDQVGPITDQSEIVKAHLSTNKEFLLLVHNSPSYVEIINMRQMLSFKVYNISNIHEFAKLISCSILEDQKKASKRLYIVVQWEERVKLRVIQFQNMRQDHPKEREKVLMENKQCFLFPKSQFKRDSPSSFLVYCQNTLKHFKAINKENNLHYKQQNHSLPSPVQALFASQTILAFEQADASLAFIGYEKSNRLLTLTVIQTQTYSLLHAIKLNRPQNQFMGLGQCSGFYLVQTSEQVMIVSQNPQVPIYGFNFFYKVGKLSLNLLIKSSDHNQMLMSYSLSNENNPYIYDIIIHLDEEEDEVLHPDSPIKQFQEISLEAPNSLVKVKGLSEKAEKQINSIQEFQSSQELEVPPPLSHLVSFGQQNITNKFKYKKLQPLVSFGHINIQNKVKQTPANGLITEKIIQKDENTESKGSSKKQQNQRSPKSIISPSKKQNLQTTAGENPQKEKQQRQKILIQLQQGTESFKSDILERVSSFKRGYIELQNLDIFDQAIIFSQSLKGSIRQSEIILFQFDLGALQTKNQELRSKTLQHISQIQSYSQNILRWKQKLGWNRQFSCLKKRNIDHQQYLIEKLAKFRTQTTFLQLSLKENLAQKVQKQYEDWRFFRRIKKESNGKKKSLRLPLPKQYKIHSQKQDILQFKALLDD